MTRWGFAGGPAAHGASKTALLTTTYKQPGLHTRAFLDLFKVRAARPSLPHGH